MKRVRGSSGVYSETGDSPENCDRSLQGLGCGSQHESLFRSLRPRGTRWVGSNVVWSLPRKLLAYIEPKLLTKNKQHFLRIGWWKEKLHGENSSWVVPSFFLSCWIVNCGIVEATTQQEAWQLCKGSHPTSRGWSRGWERQLIIEVWWTDFQNYIQQMMHMKSKLIARKFKMKHTCCLLLVFCRLFLAYENSFPTSILWLCLTSWLHFPKVLSLQWWQPARNPRCKRLW